MESNVTKLVKLGVKPEDARALVSQGLDTPAKIKAENSKDKIIKRAQSVLVRKKK